MTQSMVINVASLYADKYYDEEKNIPTLYVQRNTNFNPLIVSGLRLSSVPVLHPLKKAYLSMPSVV
ncbi:hypothetical protein [Photobacterium sanguinicancri]|uniref:hypothetical protein n=1 Tax=Photobacterium sanguinicancri TaxID=875932 RepID=UPI0026E27A41|nr:hypothetical protein [Photobacterium sanguinicancri]MDO6496511.1 hypothetical protein [Photobacterium sanguinicancri]